jgi:hypothetical protein
MPLTDGLGEEILKRLSQRGRDVPSSLPAGRFETWLSRLAEPQPDLDETTNVANHAVFLEISQLVRELVLDAENLALSEPLPWVIQRLVGVLHWRQSTVATFNYDTLLERAVAEQRRLDFDTNTNVRRVHVIEDRPPRPPRPGIFGDGEAASLRLLKLHGSVDTFWVTGDSSGATINRLDSNGYWSPEPDATERRRLLLPGREPFIVPPAAAKSAFYSNPFTRQLWRDTATALRMAHTVDIVGYSLPPTDLVASGMLADTLASSHASIRVVNTGPAAVVSHLEDLGCDRNRISEIGGQDPVARYADQLESECSPIDRRSEVIEYAVSLNALLLVGLNRHAGAAVIDLVRDPADAALGHAYLEPLKPFDRITDSRGPGDPSLVSAEELVNGIPIERLQVHYATGEAARVVDVQPWSVSTGHHGQWLQLVPSAIPQLLV